MDGASHLDMVYKLLEYAGKPGLELSSRKVLYPGRKQVSRQSRTKIFPGDIVGRFDDTLPGKPSRLPVMRAGAVRLSGHLARCAWCSLELE
jgi:nicotinate phosphoribosyltransferase